MTLKQRLKTEGKREKLAHIEYSHTQMTEFLHIGFLSPVGFCCETLCSQWHDCAWNLKQVVRGSRFALGLCVCVWHGLIG